MSAAKYAITVLTVFASMWIITLAIATFLIGRDGE